MSRYSLALVVLAGLAHPAFAQVDQEMLAGDPVSPHAEPPPPPPPAAAPASPDVDLSSLGVDPDGYDDKLAFYGFADVGFVSDNWNADVGVVPTHAKTFLVGHLDVYLAKNLSARARTLAEIRFTFLPNGSRSLIDGSVTDNAVTDPTDYYRTTQWGSVIIERVYVEYDVSEHLTIRAGHWLTPYGIWNTDHGSPVIIPVVRPFIIGEQFFPEHQTGLELFGSHYRGGFRIGYHLTASNGRGASEAQADQDNKLAFGGRLELETPWGLKLGGSYYRGRYTGAAPAGGVAPTYLEAAYGGDLRFERGPLLVQAEVIARDRRFPADAIAAAAAAGRPMPGSRDFGYYVLAGYRFARLWNAMPFVFFEDERPSDPSYFTRSVEIDAGVNFRPIDSLVLKAVAVYDVFDGSVGVVDGHTLYELAAQAAWAF